MTKVTLVVALTLALFSTPAGARERLNDRASPIQRIDVEIDWYEDKPFSELSDDELNRMVATIDRLEVRLDTSQWIRRDVRIYLTLPLEIRGLRSSSSLRLNWTTDGKLADGTLIPGSDAVVFDGVLGPDEVEIVEFFRMRLQLDSREMIGPLTFEPVFEIEAK